MSLNDTVQQNQQEQKMLERLGRLVHISEERIKFNVSGQTFHQKQKQFQLQGGRRSGCPSQGKTEGDHGDKL